jgi:50S ribosomal protein L16 3-hydroxylase
VLTTGISNNAPSPLDGILPRHVLDQFIQHHFQKFPFSIRTGGEAAACLCDRDRMLSWAIATRADVLLARQGEQISPAPALSPETIRDHLAQGCTLVVRHVERLDEGVASLARDFEQRFWGSVDVQAYWTPSGQFGFGWHYDAEDVFVVQVEGTKEYSLRKNTVHPWPTLDSMPANLRYEREIMPLMRCSLERGNVLYVPAGYWHKATAQAESITLSIGVMSHTRLDLLSFLGARLASRLEWRERLPIVGAANSQDNAALHESLAEIVRQAAVDLAASLADDHFVAEWLNWLRPATPPLADQPRATSKLHPEVPD